MRYKLLGKTGLRVSELALGAMTFGEDWGWGASLEESRSMVRAFAERGGNFLDTAVNYTNGTSEKIVGEITSAERERWVIATKYTLTTDPKDPNAGGNHRKNLVRSLERSLKSLRTDHVDLLWMHAWDEVTPVAEVVRALDDVVRAGKVLYVGISDTPAWVVSQANTLADLRGWTPFSALQIEYSLIQRTVERELLPMAKAFGLAVTPWAALGGGVLTGKYSSGGHPSDAPRAQMNQARVSERNLAIAAEVKKIAAEMGKSSSQVALAWVRAQDPAYIPIIGARKLSQLQDNLGCLDVSLTHAQLARLDAVSRVDLGFPTEFLAQPFIRGLVHGENWDKNRPLSGHSLQVANSASRRGFDPSGSRRSKGDN